MRWPDAIDLLVVGAGPTGLAALAAARRRGIEAIGVDAGGGPLAAVNAYPDGLVLTSPAEHFEIAGLPFDCRDRMQVTREEVLHYYARVIHHHRLVVRPARCRALVPEAGGVQVRLGAGTSEITLRARHVVFTAWYEPVPPPPSLLDSSGRTRTVTRVRSPAAVAGETVTVVGGGLSAYEQAASLMMHGHSVVLLARHGLLPYFRAAPFRALVTATGSRVFERASVDSVRSGAVHARIDGEEVCFPTSLLVASLGSRCSPDALAMLTGCGVLTTGEAAQLGSVTTSEHLLRTGAAPDPGAALERVIDTTPDLWSRLFEGVNGIHCAGGALHAGGSTAGVVVSTRTAELAVAAIAGEALPAGFAPPLPRALWEWANALERREPTFGSIAALRPLAIRAWTRTACPPSVLEDAAGLATSLPASPARYTVGPLAADEGLGELLAACDGTHTVADLAEAAGAESPGDRQELVRVLYNLLKNNGLTWLPAARDLQRRAFARASSDS